jgi:methylenetetrahydrofolate dehydrogenase (NADP+)/methenyltetrahydrofolate cyclohydrolase
MPAQLISGREISATIREEIKDRVDALRASTGRVPGLATVLVGEDPASKLYVGMKKKAAEAAGLHSEQIILAADTPEDELLGVVEGLNANPEIHGILVQLPLPPQIDEHKVLLAIDPRKDVDGFHPVNVGKLSTGARDVLAPCTPWGVVQMLLRTGNDPSGKHVVVVGRSNIVGRPMASLLGAVTRTADILIVAVGRPGTVTADMVRPGAVVIDVGTNRVDAPDTERGYRVVGDVDFEAVSEVASWITPVPGGVGPMTITMLLSNTVDAFEAAEGVE